MIYSSMMYSGMAYSGMSQPERIMTLHPAGKVGVNILKSKYDQVRKAIILSVRESGTTSFKDLTATVHDRLSGQFDGSIGWYVVTVKLDLEARGVLERVPKSSPQQLRMGPVQPD